MGTLQQTRPTLCRRLVSGHPCVFQWFIFLSQRDPHCPLSATCCPLPGRNSGKYNFLYFCTHTGHFCCSLDPHLMLGACLPCPGWTRLQEGQEASMVCLLVTRETYRPSLRCLLLEDDAGCRWTDGGWAHKDSYRVGAGGFPCILATQGPHSEEKLSYSTQGRALKEAGVSSQSRVRVARPGPCRV